MTKKKKENTAKTKTTSPLLLLLFFLSGFAGLCYQVVWIRELSVIFGKTNAAITVVVSVFMLGLGLGSIYWGKRKIPAGKLSNTFGWLQFGIAGGSLILLLVFPYLSVVYQGLVSWLNLSYSWVLMLIFFLCAILIFIPTFLMGGTFPVISQLYIRKEAKIGKEMGLLYGINTLGGILGAGLTGYFLVGLMGQRETQLLGIITNVVLGLAFLKMKEPTGETGEIKKEKEKDKDKRKKTEDLENKRVLKFLVWGAFLTGFAGLGYEILWSRALATFTSNSIYSFSSILVIYLIGMSIGSFIYGRFLSNTTRSIPLLIYLQFFIFVVVSITAIFLNDIPVLITPFRDLLTYPLLGMVLPGLFLSFIIIFLPTVLMGIVFPLMCRMYANTIEHLRDRVGRLYFYNTLGSMVGPIAAGFISIPLVGVVKGLMITGLVNLFLALFGWVVVVEKNFKRKKLLLGFGLIIAAFILLPFIMGKSTQVLPPSVFRTPNNPQELKYYKETADGTVSVVEDINTGVRSCYVNNSAVCGTTYDALKVVHYMGHLPMIINPNAKKALIIGFGIGVTTSAAAQHPLDSIDCVEICPGVKESAPLFEQFNRRVWENPKINFIAGDGRNYLLLTREKYDMISCDPVHPTLGSGSLYTKEYFELCKSRLTEGGVISQYLPLHKLTRGELKTLLNTFYSVFPDSMVWIAQSHGVLIGSNRELHLSFYDIQSAITRIDDPFFKDPYLLGSTLLLDKKGIEYFVKDHTRINSDNRSVLEYFSTESMETKNHYSNISALLQARQPVLQLISDVPDPYLMERYVRAQLYYLEGMLNLNHGERERAFNLFRHALSINPENGEIRLFLKH